jgi:hypothetical protein
MNEPQIELIQEAFFFNYHAFDARISAKNGILFDRVQIVMGVLPKKVCLGDVSQGVVIGSFFIIM